MTVEMQLAGGMEVLNRRIQAAEKPREAIAAFMDELQWYRAELDRLHGRIEELECAMQLIANTSVGALECLHSGE